MLLIWGHNRESPLQIQITHMISIIKNHTKPLIYTIITHKNDLQNHIDKITKSQGQLTRY